MRRTTLFLLALLLLSGGVMPAQPERETDPRLRYGGLQYVEAVCLPSDSAGKARVDVFVRVSHDFMIFTRAAGNGNSGSFTAAVEVSSSLRREGSTVGIDIVTAQASADDYDATIRRDRYVNVHQVFYLSPGDYELLVEIADKGSSRHTVVRQPVRARTFAAGSARIGEPFAMRHDAAAGEWGVFAHGRALPYAEPALVGIPVPAGMQADWSMRLTQSDPDGDAVDTLFEGSVQPTERLAGMLPSRAGGNPQEFTFGPVAAQGDILVFSLPFEGIAVGRYLLHVRAAWDGRSDTLSVPLHILWRDMPFSMRDIDFAIDAMRFILTKEEYERMKDGNERERQRAFRQFWAERDSSPETGHNEMMTEYFRRIDEAYYRFQTIYVRNGVETDRGKVYVLFGPPEHQQRIMTVDTPVTEVWSYPSLEKTFRFVDKEGDGNLRLMEE